MGCQMPIRIASLGRWGLGSAAVLLLALVTNLGSPAAITTPAGHWRGSGRATRAVDLQLATITMSTQSDFWFTISQAGDVDGYAVSSYQLTLDDAKLRARLAWANSNANGALGLVPGVGALLGTGVSAKDAIGLTAVCDEAMPVRSGRIKGKLTGNTLHLSWAEPPDKIPYKRYVIYATKEQLQAASTMGAFGPWTSDAVVAEISPGEFEAAVNASRSQTADGNTKISALWTAYRVNSVH